MQVDTRSSRPPDLVALGADDEGQLEALPPGEGHPLHPLLRAPAAALLAVEQQRLGGLVLRSDAQGLVRALRLPALQVDAEAGDARAGRPLEGHGRPRLEAAGDGYHVRAGLRNTNTRINQRNQISEITKPQICGMKRSRYAGCLSKKIAHC